LRVECEDPINDKEQFTIVTRDNEEITFYSKERERLLTEIQIERESIPKEVWQHYNLNADKEIYEFSRYWRKLKNVVHTKNVLFKDDDERSKYVTLLITGFGICADYSQDALMDDNSPPF